MAEARPTPASEPSPSSSAAPAPAPGSAAPRPLPPALLPPRPSNGSRGAGGGVAAGSGKKNGKAAAAEGTMRRHERLVEAARLVGRGGVDRGLAGADILELAMAKGAMFSWLRYWPEEGYPKEDQPY